MVMFRRASRSSFSRQGGHLPAVHDDGAAGGPLQQVHAPHQGALAGAGEADDAEDLPGPDVQVDVLQGPDLALAGAEDLGQVLDLNDGFTHRTQLLYTCDVPGNKKALEAKASRTRVRGRRGTTLLHRPLAETAFGSAITLLRCHGRARRDLCRNGSRPRDSGTMFSEPFRASFHPPRLSVPDSARLLFPSSSLRMYLKDFHSLSKERRQSMGNSHIAAPRWPRFVRTDSARRKPRDPGKFFTESAGIGLQPQGKTAMIARQP